MPCGLFFSSYEKDEAIFKTVWVKCWMVLFFILIFTVPLYADWLTGLFGFAVAVDHCIMMCIYIVGAHGLNLLTGFTGQISLGHAAFMGVGAYSCGILANAGVPFFIALPMAGLMSAAVGMVFGVPSLRLRGLLPGHSHHGGPVHSGPHHASLGGRDRRLRRPQRAPAQYRRVGDGIGRVHLLPCPGRCRYGYHVCKESGAHQNRAGLCGGEGPLPLGGSHWRQPVQIPHPELWHQFHFWWGWPGGSTPTTPTSSATKHSPWFIPSSTWHLSSWAGWAMCWALFSAPFSCTPCPRCWASGRRALSGVFPALFHRPCTYEGDDVRTDRHRIFDFRAGRHGRQMAHHQELLEAVAVFLLTDRKYP